MNRRRFITAVGVAAAAAFERTHTARAQQAKGRSFRIGYLSFIPGEDSNVILKQLDELGYHQGENLDVAYRSAEGQSERLGLLAADWSPPDRTCLLPDSER
jgi:hypothetical protein